MICERNYNIPADFFLNSDDLEGASQSFCSTFDALIIEFVVKLETNQNLKAVRLPSVEAGHCEPRQTSL